MTPDDTARVLTQWARCVQRLMQKTPIKAVASETGTIDRHDSLDIVDEWLSRDLVTLARPAPDAALDVKRLAVVMRGMCDCIRSDEDAALWARDIAREYAATPEPADPERSDAERTTCAICGQWASNGIHDDSPDGHAYLVRQANPNPAADHIAIARGLAALATPEPADRQAGEGS